jgi:hypothetical protein
MIDKPEDPASAMNVTAHALRMSGAIASNAREPAAVIANADPTMAWLTGGEQADLRRRLVTAYQQRDNQHGGQDGDALQVGSLGERTGSRNRGKRNGAEV